MQTRLILVLLALAAAAVGVPFAVAGSEHTADTLGIVQNGAAEAKIAATFDRGAVGSVELAPGRYLNCTVFPGRDHATCDWQTFDAGDIARYGILIPDSWFTMTSRDGHACLIWHAPSGADRTDCPVSAGSEGQIQ